jgi:hypothetical protein
MVIDIAAADCPLVGGVDGTFESADTSSRVRLGVVRVHLHVGLVFRSSVPRMSNAASPASAVYEEPCPPSSASWSPSIRCVPVPRQYLPRRELCDEVGHAGATVGPPAHHRRGADPGDRPRRCRRWSLASDFGGDRRRGWRSMRRGRACRLEAGHRRGRTVRADRAVIGLRSWHCQWFGSPP